MKSIFLNMVLLVVSVGVMATDFASLSTERISDYFAGKTAELELAKEHKLPHEHVLRKKLNEDTDGLYVSLKVLAAQLEARDSVLKSAEERKLGRRLRALVAVLCFIERKFDAGKRGQELFRERVVSLPSWLSMEPIEISLTELKAKPLTITKTAPLNFDVVIVQTAGGLCLVPADVVDKMTSDNYGTWIFDVTSTNIVELSNKEQRIVESWVGYRRDWLQFDQPQRFEGGVLSFVDLLDLNGFWDS